MELESPGSGRSSSRRSSEEPLLSNGSIHYGPPERPDPQPQSKRERLSRCASSVCLVAAAAVAGPVALVLLALASLLALLGALSSDTLGGCCHCLRWVFRCCYPRHGPPESASAGDELLEDYMRLFLTDDRALVDEQPLLPVEGTVPSWLRGTYYLNGPGLVWAHGELICPLDGHAYLRAFRFMDGIVRLTTRFVETDAYKIEAAAGRRLFRGLGTLLPGRWPRLRNLFAKAFTMDSPNVSVVRWGEWLLSLGESCRAFYVLDPETLETTGRGFPIGRTEQVGERMLGHSRIDTQGRLVVASRNFSDSSLRFLEVDAQGEVVAERLWVMPRPCYVHDFIVLDQYYVVLETPCRVSWTRLVQGIFGWQPITAALRTEQRRESYLVLIPRDASAEPYQFPLGEHYFCSHHINAWIEGDRLQVHALVMRNFQVEDSFGYSHLKGGSLDARWSAGKGCGMLSLTADLVSGEVASAFAPDLKGEFPEVHPCFEGRPNRWCYLVASQSPDLFTPCDTLLQVALDTRAVDQQWLAPERVFLGEPKVVPSGSNEDEGLIALQLHNCAAGRSELALFRLGHVAEGPVCRVACDRMLPLAFHGSWCQEDPEETPRRLAHGGEVWEPFRRRAS